MNKLDRVAFQELQTDKWTYIHKKVSDIKNHPDYAICEEKVDALMCGDYHEAGAIVGISPTREGFDELYEDYDVYRGSYCEIKVGDNYVIYGFEFD